MSNVFHLTVFVVIALFALPISQRKINSCGNWADFDGKCYKSLDIIGNYQDGSRKCSEIDNSTLLRIETEQEQKNLMKFLMNHKNISTNVWLDLKLQDQSYFWKNGKHLSYNNWSEDAAKDDPCVQMSLNENSFGQWNDVSCNRKCLVVCQKSEILNVQVLKKNIEEVLDDLDSMKKGLQESIDRNRAHLNHLQSSYIPFGFIYVQFSAQPEPNILWPEFKWHDISHQYAGRFFRAVGGNAEAFGKDQLENSPRLSLVQYNYLKATNKDSQITAIEPGKWSGFVATGNWAQQNVDAIRFLITGGEVRPINTAIRIWRRT